ncbi:amino acid/amide ABC transporter ATP-binding protein 2, HAAT family [Nocardioides sp. YR527]|uniref:ABC transporter ATP-binding protein n=1 Tax=Nocardioides sp. YR527 TaxID=1881028 RepID=UPI000885683A|nr:ABC transporter ATP-binding protein [Nocardioides sp. YR527]SDL32137.1 amino acid/amide ABC transporter ATP-binding protein 2, HAAT family [Nocardioides sp. YR527]
MTTAMTPSSAPVLVAEHVTAGYGDVRVLQELDLRVHAGEIVALLGRNGAGKSTTLSTLAGLVTPSSGRVLLNGKARRDAPFRRVRDGLAYVVEERGVLLGLTTAQNLRLGPGSVADALAYFPEIEPHLGRQAGLLSGGQQQMLAVARALASRPRVLMIDELSLGLAPMFVERLLQALRQAREAGVGVLLVEQHARTALRVADRAYVLNQGRVALDGPAADLLERLPEIEHAYLGGDPAQT